MSTNSPATTVPKKKSPKKKAKTASARKKASPVSRKRATSPAKKKKVASSKKATTTRKVSLRDLEAKHQIDLRDEAKRLEELNAEERVSWALKKFRRKIVMSSSFGAQSAVSLHMLTQQRPNLPVILVDTGYLFKETYEFIEQLNSKLSLNLKVYRNDLSPAWQEAKHGKLWEQGVEGIEKYNAMNKVEPMNRALEELKADAVFSGLRRKQSKSRKNLPVVVSQRGRIKIHPIIDWTDKDVYMYLKKHDLPYHPLWEDGYVSIGDWHTTRKLSEGMSEEDTRFFGLKRECGLHEDTDFQI